MDLSDDIHMALLQIHTTPLGQGLPSPATSLFNCLVHGVMPVIDRKPIIGDNDEEHHIKLVHRQHKNDPNNDASQVLASIPRGSTVAVQEKMEDCGPMEQLLGRETTITMTGHITYRLQQPEVELHATDNISGQHQ